MNFGEALEALKQGKKIARSVWGGYWELLSDAGLMVERNDVYYPVDQWSFTHLIIAVLKDNKGVAPAMPYQEDILAEDWMIVE